MPELDLLINLLEEVHTIEGRTAAELNEELKQQSEFNSTTATTFEEIMKELPKCSQ